MLKNNSFYRGSDLLLDDYRSKMNSYFNPYESNIESNQKDTLNNDKVAMKSKSHSIRKYSKNKMN